MLGCFSLFFPSPQRSSIYLHVVRSSPSLPLFFFFFSLWLAHHISRQSALQAANYRPHCGAQGRMWQRAVCVCACSCVKCRHVTLLLLFVSSCLPWRSNLQTPAPASSVCRHSSRFWSDIPSVLTSVALNVHEGLCMCGWATSRIFNPSPSHTVLQLWLIQGGGRKKWRWACAQTHARAGTFLLTPFWLLMFVRWENSCFLSFHVMHKSYSSLGVLLWKKKDKATMFAAELKEALLESSHPSSSSKLAWARSFTCCCWSTGDPR